MSAIDCVIPLTIRLRGTPGEERLAQLIDTIATTIAARLRTADRIIGAREGQLSTRTYIPPTLHFSGTPLPDALRHRITQAVEAGLRRALPGGARAPASPFTLAQYVPPTAAPQTPPAAPDDGIRIAAGGEKAFWAFWRGALFTKVVNGVGASERDDAIKLLLQGIKRAEAQSLLREALDQPVSGVRMAVVLALGKIKHDHAIAWKLLLYGLERPGDLVGYGPFDDHLEAGSDAMIAFLDATLAGTDEPYRTNAGRVVRRFLDGQFDPRNAARRPTYDRLRKLAARAGLYAKGPLGADAVRDRIARLIQVLLVALANVSYPLTPAVPRETPQSDDVHTLDGLVPLLEATAKSLPTLKPEELEALDQRILHVAEMIAVLPDRIQTIQTSILGIARLLPNDDVPSDEIVVLQQLRRRYLRALRTAPSDDSAIESFRKAEELFADLRMAVADVKFARLSHEFDDARAAVGNGDALIRTGETDPGVHAMSDLLRGYTRAFVALFTPHGVSNTMPIMVMPMADTLETTVQLETDLALYRVLGSMFLLYSAALRYDRDIYGTDGNSAVRNASWRAGISARLGAIRTKIAAFWNQEDLKGYIAAAPGLQSDIETIQFEIARGIERDRDIRTAILLAATLVAGVAGILVRAALVGVLLEASAGATRLAVAVTLTEATVFTGTQLALEHVAFGTPFSPAAATKSLLLNIAQFSAFAAVSRALGPLGSGSKTWLGFLGRHATGIVLQIDIAALSLAVQGRGFPPDTAHFLIETVGAYVIGATTSYIGGRVQNAAIQARQTEFAALRENIARRAVEAINTGRWDETAFLRTQKEVVAYWGRIEAANNFLRDAGLMSASEHAEAQAGIDAARTRAANAKFAGAATFGGPLLLDAGAVPGLVRVGTSAIYRYDPQHPPARLAEMVRSYQRIGSLRTTFEQGTLVVRELGSGKLLLLLGPGPVPAGLLPPAPPGVPPPRPWTFLESAAGHEMTQAGLAATTALVRSINRDAITTLEARGATGMAALSLLIEHRLALGKWSIKAIRGLATALELPRAITRFNLQRFFARPSAEIAELMEQFGDIAGMPGANLVFRQPATQRTILLVDLYRELLGRGFALPADMNESGQRGLIFMVATLGREIAIQTLAASPVARRLALLVRYDPLVAQAPVVPLAQQILDRHAGDLRPGLNLADPARTPAQLRADIEAFAQAHGGTLDSHIPARIEATIKTYRDSLRRVQDGTETDGRNVDGAREEFNAMLLVLERGAKILSFSRVLGAKKHDTFEAQINVGWHPLRGRITVINGPTEAPAQIDVLSHSITGIEVQEVTFGHLGLPESLKPLATVTGPVTIDHKLLSNETSHRKWKQILRNIALTEFAEEMFRGWGGTPTPVRIVVRARSASPDAVKALANIGVHLELIPP